MISYQIISVHFLDLDKHLLGKYVQFTAKQIEEIRLDVRDVFLIQNRQAREFLSVNSVFGENISVIQPQFTILAMQV